MAVATRGLEIFDRLVIGVGVNTSKQGLLEPERRAQLIRDAFNGEPRVEVVVYDGMTGDLCRRRGIVHMLRGLRNSNDFEYERDMEMAQAQIYPEIATVAVFTPADFIAVSSRLVREIITLGGDPAKFLPPDIDIKKYI
jgi:pantetheine-phosphate adenylyltransferase